MRVIVLDDLPDAVPYAQEQLNKFKNDTTLDVPLERELSQQIGGTLYHQRLKALEELEGEAVVFLDLRYNILSQTAYSDLAAALRAKYEGPDVREPLDLIRLDGFILGCALIDNHRFWGTVVVSTGAEGGTPLPVRRLMERVKHTSREKAVQITWETFGLNDAMDHVRNGYSFDDSNEPVRKAILKHFEYFYHTDSGTAQASGQKVQKIDRFVRFMRRDYQPRSRGLLKTRERGRCLSDLARLTGR